MYWNTDKCISPFTGPSNIPYTFPKHILVGSDKSHATNHFDVIWRSPRFCSLGSINLLHSSINLLFHFFMCLVRVLACYDFRTGVQAKSLNTANHMSLWSGGVGLTWPWTGHMSTTIVNYGCACIVKPRATILKHFTCLIDNKLLQIRKRLLFPILVLFCLTFMQMFLMVNITNSGPSVWLPPSVHFPSATVGNGTCPSVFFSYFVFDSYFLLVPSMNLY